MTNVALTGGDIVNIAPGVYRESVTLTSTDDGTSESSRLVFKGSGAGTTILEGLSSTPLNDAAASACTASLNCSGDGLAYPRVYRFDVTGRTVLDVIETLWTPGRVRIDDRPRGSGGSCDSSCTGVIYDMTKPIPYHGVSGIPSVQNLSGSWYRSGNYLYVHTFDDLAPSAGVMDVETVSLQRGFYFNGSSSSSVRFVTISDMTLRYFADNGVELDNADYITMENLVVHSISGAGIRVGVASDFSVTRKVETSHVQERASDYDTVGSPCDKGCGWVTGGNGNCFSIAGTDGASTTGHLVEDLDAFNCWNSASVENVTNSRIVRSVFKNAPNHAFIMNGIPAVTPSYCRDNVIESSAAFNGQEGWYISGCQTSKLLRSVGDANYLDEPANRKAPSSGWRQLSNLMYSTTYSAVVVVSGATPGFSGDNNWYPGSGNECHWAGTSYSCASTTWPQMCSCDANRVTGSSVPLAGTSFPIPNGLAASLVTRDALRPSALSTAIIDRGSRDIDGDGIVEDGVGGDDECTPAHNCVGSAPDIGPYEYGLTGPPPTGTAPPTPENVRRTDTQPPG